MWRYIDWLIVLGFTPYRQYSNHVTAGYRDVTITDEGLQILTYTRYSWPMSIEGSLACHNYFDTHTWDRAFGSGSVTSCFNGLSRLGFEHLLLAGRTLNRLCHRSALACRKERLIEWSWFVCWLINGIRPSHESFSILLFSEISCDSRFVVFFFLNRFDIFKLLWDLYYTRWY